MSIISIKDSMIVCIAPICHVDYLQMSRQLEFSYSVPTVYHSAGATRPGPEVSMLSIPDITQLCQSYQHCQLKDNMSSIHIASLLQSCSILYAWATKFKWWRHGEHMRSELRFSSRTHEPLTITRCMVGHPCPSCYFVMRYSDGHTHCASSLYWNRVINTSSW